MGKNVTIKWYGKTDQEVMTAASTLAEVMASSGKFVQAFSDCNRKRCGAPLAAFNRISASPIKLHSEIKDADIEVILHPNLLKYIDIKSSPNGNATYILNTSLSPEYIKERFNLKMNKIFTLDINSIPPHIAHLTIVARYLGLISIENFKEKLKEVLSVRQNGENKVENVQVVMDKAIEEVREV